MHHTENYLLNTIATLRKEITLNSFNEGRILEIIANMKCNNGNVKQWARQLEDALGVERLSVTTD